MTREFIKCLSEMFMKCALFLKIENIGEYLKMSGIYCNFRRHLISPDTTWLKDVPSSSAYTAVLMILVSVYQTTVELLALRQPIIQAFSMLKVVTRPW